MTNQNQWVSKAQPAPSQVHVDRTLTNMSVAVMDSPDALADSVFPIVSVAKQSDLYRVYDRGSFQRDEMRQRAPGTESRTIGYSMSTSPYYAPVYSLAHDIDDQTVANADDEIDLDREGAMLLGQAARINRDRNWVSKFFTTGVWTDEALAAGDQFSDYVNSDPIETLEGFRMDMAERSGFAPNTVVMGPRVWQQLKNHPDLIDRINRGQTGGTAQVLLQNLADLLEVNRVLVPTQIFNAGKEGAADDFQFIFGKSLLMLYVEPNVSRYSATAGVTFAWSGFSGAGGSGVRVRRFRMENTSSRRIEIESAYSQQAIATELGTFIPNAVA